MVRDVREDLCWKGRRMDFCSDRGLVEGYKRRLPFLISKQAVLCSSDNIRQDYIFWVSSSYLPICLFPQIEWVSCGNNSQFVVILCMDSFAPMEREAAAMPRVFLYA